MLLPCRYTDYISATEIMTEMSFVASSSSSLYLNVFHRFMTCRFIINLWGRVPQTFNWKWYTLTSRSWREILTRKFRLFCSSFLFSSCLDTFFNVQNRRWRILCILTATTLQMQMQATPQPPLPLFFVVGSRRYRQNSVSLWHVITRPQERGPTGGIQISPT